MAFEGPTTESAWDVSDVLAAGMGELEPKRERREEPERRLGTCESPLPAVLWFWKVEADILSGQKDESREKIRRRRKK